MFFISSFYSFFLSFFSSLFIYLIKQENLELFYVIVVFCKHVFYAAKVAIPCVCLSVCLCDSTYVDLKLQKRGGGDGGRCSSITRSYKLDLLFIDLTYFCNHMYLVAMPDLSHLLTYHPAKYVHVQIVTYRRHSDTRSGSAKEHSGRDDARKQRDVGMATMSHS